MSFNASLVITIAFVAVISDLNFLRRKVNKLEEKITELKSKK